MKHEIITGDCIEIMRGMEAGSVQCVVTSPPYWGLRDYGTAEWEGGDTNCKHIERKARGDEKSRAMLDGSVRTGASTIQYRNVCQKCGARRIDNQLGLESTREEYIAKMVDVFREVRRVLRDDGVLWLNMGDTYAHSGACGGASPVGPRKMRATDAAKQRAMGYSVPPGLKPKDLCLMPSRLALALQADRWYVRSKLPWLKPSAMPESVRDRPTNAIEYVFLLTKSIRYFWDAEAVRVYGGSGWHRSSFTSDSDWATKNRLGTTERNEVAGRNFRTNDLFYESLKAPHGMIFAGTEPIALNVNPEPFPGAFCKACQKFYPKGSGRFKQHTDDEGKTHPICPQCGTWDEWLSHFATFGRKLVTPLIKAGTSGKGCCPECGAPWRRILEETKVRRERPADRTARHEAGNGINSCGNTVAGVAVRTIGWQPGCECAGRPDRPWLDFEQQHPELTPAPCTVFDPFCGSGTVGVVAKQLGLNFVGIDLNRDYCEMARQRIANPEPEPEIPDIEGQLTMFENADFLGETCGTERSFTEIGEA